MIFEILETVGPSSLTIGIVIAFIEWRYRILHNCIRRVEDRLDNHMDK